MGKTREDFKLALGNLAEKAEKTARLLMGDAEFEAERSRLDEATAGMTKEEKLAYLKASMKSTKA